MTRLSDTTETILFVTLTLALAYSLGAMFVLTGARHLMLLHVLMCMPGTVALMLMWFLRHEPPRVVGFEFTGWGSWGIAAAYPLAFVAAALMVAYGVRAISGHQDFIVFDSNNVQNVVLGHRFQGLSNVPVLVFLLLVSFLLWRLIALAYRRWAIRSFIS